MRRQTQADDVERALVALGGYATLADLYKRIPTQNWGTKTPFATVRRILQMDPRFFRIRPGLWGLTAQRDRILDSLQIGAAASEEQQTAFDHTYYQGLALMIGKLRGYEVFAPKPDRGKPFLGEPLGARVSLQEFPRFTYDALCQRAQTVDVIWFHRREAGLFPNTFFEIEHTTDFNNALIKFAEFQDFRVRFYIVARRERQGEFQKRIRASAFDAIRSWVKFVDYEMLVRLYEREVYAQQAGI
jgi:hypothetical protein